MTQLETTGIDWIDCPVVEINPGKLSGTPILKGTRMPAYGIVENYADGLSADEIADLFELPTDSVKTLLAFAEQRIPALRR